MRGRKLTSLEEPRLESTNMSFLWILITVFADDFDEEPECKFERKEETS